jgi:hypothetical protein
MGCTMPRASTYAKHAAKYKRQVKAKRFIKQFKKYGFHVPKEFLKIGKKYDVVDYGEDLKKLTKAKTLAKALRIITGEMEDKKFYTCDGYSFVPLSVYEKHFADLPVVITSWEVGLLRVNEWIPILKDAYPPSKGYSVYINPVYGVGVDVLVKKNGMPYTVIELTNYNKKSYLSFKDVKRYIANLNYWDKYNAHKVLVVSFPENLKNKKQPDLWEQFPTNNISIKVMRYQAKLKTI